jgi:hypothetical protein
MSVLTGELLTIRNGFIASDSCFISFGWILVALGWNGIGGLEMSDLSTAAMVRTDVTGRIYPQGEILAPGLPSSPAAIEPVAPGLAASGIPLDEFRPGDVTGLLLFAGKVCHPGTNP